MSGNWADYDPTWLVELARAQHPEESWLHTALAACTRCLQEDAETSYFVDRMEGHFARNVILSWPERGKIVLDILTDGRVGGMSIFSLAFAEHDE